MDTLFANAVSAPQTMDQEDVFQVLFNEYERVVVQSLVTSFGLEFLLRDAVEFDKNGGDVDTIVTVRAAKEDGSVGYKNPKNASAYAMRGEYDSAAYHPRSKDSNYARIKHGARVEATKTGKGIEDAYTGETIWFTSAKGHPEVKANLDHVLSAKWIHDDPARTLAGVDGPTAASDSSNLRFTNEHINKSLRDESKPDWLEAHKDEVSQEQQERMMVAHEEATLAYDSRLATAYYMSSDFAKALGKAAGKQSAMMAGRQLCGLVFTEIWLAVKERLAAVDSGFDPIELTKTLASGVKEGFARAKDKYRELLSTAADGVLSGALASVTTTLVSMFTVSTKRLGKVLRESYASLVSAARVLFINPEGYLFGERLRAAAKIIATGASVVLGSVVTDAVSKTPVASIPIVGESVLTFCGAFVTGILSCTLLLMLDRSVWVNRLVACLNDVPTVELAVEQLRLETEHFTRYAAELARIDYDELEREVSAIEGAVDVIESASSPEELNRALRSVMQTIGVSVPWTGDFGDFMEEPTARLRFS